ncbi:MAG TPA: PLP-dependent aminotransferase family protein, partial [Sediminispirochaeta sp.]|nr:PLP-dependent aminotransferase family protein [Sediminispirochaeta sp.]
MSLYRDIFTSIKEGIERGTYPPGSKLPSIRELAAERGCNKLTVKKAFDLLKESGLIENQVGRGSFVRYRQLDRREKAHVYSFHSAYIGEVFFPVEEAEEIFARLFRDEKGLFASAPVGGEAELIAALAERYRLPADRTIVISGAQQGLNLCGNLLDANVSRHMLFEDPTYSGAIRVFKPLHFVPLETDGPRIDALRRVLAEDIRFFYSMPQVHNPTGISYSKEKIETITELAKEHDLFIIEDDYLSEFLPQRALRFIDIIPERTIYIKSLSKISAPGIRLGFMTVPPRLYERLLANKYAADIGTASLMQKFLAKFIESGALDRHLDRCSQSLRDRKTRVMELLSRYPFLKMQGRQHGYNLWVGSELPLDYPDPPWAAGSN